MYRQTKKKMLKNNEAGKNENNHRFSFSNRLMTFQGTYSHQVAVHPAYKS